MSQAGQPTQPGAGQRGRALGREVAFLAACHFDQEGRPDSQTALASFWTDAPASETGGSFAALVRDDAVARAFAEALTERLVEDWTAVNDTLEGASERWRLARMDLVDRNVLRVACVELRLGNDTPPRVIAAEAVKLAGRYGSERSGRFVNGVVSTLVSEAARAD